MERETEGRYEVMVDENGGFVMTWRDDEGNVYPEAIMDADDFEAIGQSASVAFWDDPESVPF